MTNIPIIPPWRFSAHCPQCGMILKIERDTESSGIELKGDERLFCPTHGNVMSLEEARRAVFEDNRDDIIDKARNVARDLLRDAFKK
jgi:hypothetical protein